MPFTSFKIAVIPSIVVKAETYIFKYFTFTSPVRRHNFKHHTRTTGRNKNNYFLIVQPYFRYTFFQVRYVIIKIVRQI